MKLIKQYAGFLLMLTLLVGFTSCEDDEDIYDDLMGRTWVGDLGFGTNRDPIESGFAWIITAWELIIRSMIMTALLPVTCLFVGG